MIWVRFHNEENLEYCMESRHDETAAELVDWGQKESLNWWILSTFPLHFFSKPWRELPACAQNTRGDDGQLQITEGEILASNLGMPCVPWWHSDIYVTQLTLDRISCYSHVIVYLRSSIWSPELRTHANPLLLRFIMDTQFKISEKPCQLEASTAIRPAWDYLSSMPRI